MNWVRVKTSLSLDDPEEGFSFEKKGPDVTVKYHDWRNAPCAITFRAVEKFTYSYHPPYPEIAEGSFLEAEASPMVLSLETAQHINPEDGIRHFLISTNEDEWCEVLAEDFEEEMS